MALSGTLLANKDASPQGYQPLLLASFTFADGSVLRASTHPLNTAEGGNQYAGNDYVARLQSQDIQQLQARSQEGIDRISDVTLHLYNADQSIFSAYEMASGKGFKGAKLQLAIVLSDIDPDTGNYVFTNDSPAPVKFSGICDAPQVEQGGGTITVRATTSHNLSRVDFPIIHVQQRCPWVFPRNAAERLAGGTDMSDWRWNCGYDPDQSGTDPEIGGDCKRGNTTTAGATDPQGNVIADGSGIFISCGYTKQDCIARGMYSADSSARVTGRFGGFQWATSSASRESQSRSYGQGKDVTVFSGRNDSIYNRSVPMLYGSQWIKAPIVCNVLGDGNSTRMEVVICVGNIGTSGIWTVLVNGVIVPPIESAHDKKLMRWNFADAVTYTSSHTGSRNGLATADAGYDSNGDPYGGYAMIEIVVYSELAQSNSVPDVRILCNGPKVKTPNTSNPTDQASWPYVVTTLPPWQLADALVWANYTYADFDLAQWITEANYCGGTVSYIDPFGNSKTHNRFICQFSLEERRKANEVIQAVLRGFNGQLVPNSETGLLQLFIRKTLADQQSSPVAGSNYNTAIASLHADNTTGNGYVAYLIDESVIQSDGRGGMKMRGPYTLPSAQCPNTVNFPFQDEENVYSDDSISVVDPEDVARAAGYAAGGAQIGAGFPVLGVSNFDQGIRQANVILAESLRGNRWGDTRGAYFWDIEVTSRCEHLRVGHIVLFRFQAQALRPAIQLESPPGTPIMGILARVESIKPTTNYERMTLTIRWHEDEWYTDLYGQQSAQLYSDPRKSLPPRPPYPWKPYAEQPISGNSMWSTSAWNFAIAQNYDIAGDGTPIAQLIVAGCPPVNQLSGGSTALQPPFMPMQAATANTGGTIPGGTRVLMAISAQDSDGKWSTLSVFSQVDIPTGTNTNTATTPTINWPSGVSAWVLFAGTDDHVTLCAQSSAAGTTPSTITITSLNVSTYGPPDSLADSLLFEVKRVIHGGVWGDVCTAVASNGDGTGTITFATDCMTHQFQQTSSTVGYDLTLIAKGSGSTDNVPIADFHVIDNTLGVYHVKPDPTISVAAGDVFEMRTFPVVTATTIRDDNFVNAYAPDGFGVAGDEEVGHRVRIIKGTGVGQVRNIIGNNATILTIDTSWHTTPDNTSRFIIEEQSWQNQPYSQISNGNLTPSPAPTVGVLDISNYQKQTILVRALVADQQSNTSIGHWSPFREIYLWGAQGTRTITDDTTERFTDGLLLCDTSTATPPSATTLGADITVTTTPTAISTAANVTPDTTYMKLDSGGAIEYVQIVSGGGTTSPTVERGMLGTSAVTHTTGAAVALPGKITITLLESSGVPNKKLAINKISPDINYVLVTAGGTDTFPGGGTDLILPDTTSSAGTTYFIHPGA